MKTEEIFGVGRKYAGRKYGVGTLNGGSPRRHSMLLAMTHPHIFTSPHLHEAGLSRSLRSVTVTAPLQIKSLDATGRFAGYASVFGVVDAQKDVVVRGAFEKSLRARRGEIKLLWQHRPDEPVGTIERLFEDSKGLYVEGTLLLKVARSREAFALLKSGALDGLSIGYMPIRSRKSPLSGARELTEVDLLEVSLVTFPANARARVMIVRN